MPLLMQGGNLSQCVCIYIYNTSPHCILCACACSVAQSCPTLCNPMDCRPPGSSVHGILQARILEQVAISYSSGYCPPRDWTHVSCVSCIGRWILNPLSHLRTPLHTLNNFKLYLWRVLQKKLILQEDFPGGPVVKNPSASAEDTGSIPGLGRFHMLWGN